MERVLDFQADGIATGYSWAASISNVTLMPSGVASLTALSLCLRVFFPFFRGVHALFALDLHRRDEEAPSMSYWSAEIAKEGIFVLTNGQSSFVRLIAVPGYWNNLCFQIHFENSSALVILNGHSEMVTINVTSDFQSPTTPATLVFGQVRNALGDYVAEASLRGRITQFSLWTRPLGHEEIEKFSRCVAFDGDAVVRWAQLATNLVLNDSATVVQLPVNETCRQRGKFRALISPPLHLRVAESICNLLKGQLIVEGDVTNAVDQTDSRLLALEREGVVARRLNASQPSPPRGPSLNYERDKWTHAYRMINKHKEQMGNYRPTDPNDSDATRGPLKPLRRRARQAPEKAEEEGSPIGVELDFSAVCEFEEAPVFRGMGYCPELMDLLEENYVLQSHLGERPLFQGFTGKSITYAREIWIAQSPLSPSIELWYQKPLYERFVSPMGRHLWLLLLTIDEEIMDREVALPCDTEEIFLNLTPCFPGMFTCSNGDCLPHSVRCDRKADCEDNSDEEFCSKVYVPLSSRSDLPPPPLDGSNVTKVAMKISILATEIRFNSMKMSCELSLTWMDPTITIYNLDKDPLANIIDEETFFEMWAPTLEFGHNSIQRLSPKNASEAVILKQELGEVENFEFSWEAMSYKGSQNSIQIKQTLDIDAKCTFNAFLFPFGEQRCSFPFKLLSSSPNVVALITSGAYGGVDLEKAKQELILDFNRIQLVSSDENLYSTKELIFKMYPRMGLAMINLFFPSFLLVVIALSSFYFSVSNQQLRLGTSLSTLICFMALQIQVGSSLMDETGVKASDIWLFGCFFIVVAMNLSHVYIVTGIHKKKETVATAKVLPVTSMHGTSTRTREISYSSLEDRTQQMSNKIRLAFTILIPIVILIYIISFAVMATTYKF